MFRSKRKAREQALKTVVKTIATEPLAHARKEIAKFLNLQNITFNTDSKVMRKFNRDLTDLKNALELGCYFFPDNKKAVVAQADAELASIIEIIWLICGLPREIADPYNTQQVVESKRAALNYAELSKTWRENETENFDSLFSELRKKVLDWCDTNAPKPDVRAHYTALSQSATRPSKHSLEPAVLLVGHKKQTTGYVWPEDLHFQAVENLSRNSRTGSVLVLLPQNVADDIIEKTVNPLQPVCFSVLQHDSKTLQTALKLYSENKEHSFEHYVELATLL